MVSPTALQQPPPINGGDARSGDALSGSGSFSTGSFGLAPPTIMQQMLPIIAIGAFLVLLMRGRG